jgi:hypothetical protein
MVDDGIGENLAILNDRGVSLYHNSQSYLENVRFPQFCNTPVATWQVPVNLPTDDLDTGENDTLGVSDPIAREIQTSNRVKEIAESEGDVSSPSQAYALSIIRAHEPVHAGIADRFSHIYGNLRMGSFVKSIQIVTEGPHKRPQTFWHNYVKPILFKIWKQVYMSELTQEAIALRNQRAFLKQLSQFGGKKVWEQPLRATEYYKHINQCLKSGSLKESNWKRPPEQWIRHALGDWLAQRLYDRIEWTIGPLDFAFRLHKITTRDEPGGSVAPDQILAILSHVPSNEVAELDRDDQIEYLFNYCEAGPNNFSHDSIILRGDGENINSAPSVISPREALTRLREANYQRAADDEAYHLLPVYATSYPHLGTDDQRSFWKLLDGIAVDTTNRNGQKFRRVWLENRFGWARNTPILSLAIHLWHLRDRILLPIVRSYQGTTKVDASNHLSYAETVADGKRPSFTKFGETDPSDKSFQDKVKRVHEQTPALQDQYDTLLDGLESFGRAIYEEDSETIASFYNS